MALSFVDSPDKDFSAGIDARSSENQIDPGFVRELKNADIVEKRARKRPGYQGFAGNLPIRVTEMEYNDAANEICFTLDSAVSLDSSVSLETVRSSPLVIYGRSSTFTTGQGPFTTTGDAVEYYPSFTIPIRKQLVAPSGTLTVAGTEHNLGTTSMFVDVVQSTSLTDRSYAAHTYDNIRIDETSFDVDVDYTLTTSQDAFVFFADKTAATGEVYVATLSHTGSGSETFTVPAGTHNLASYNIVMQIQQDTGAERVLVRPDAAEIATNGTVSLTLTSGSAGTFYAILSAAPVANVVTGVVPALSTGTVVIPEPTRPWTFLSVYLEQTPCGTKELVLPDSITYSETANEIVVSFTNSIATPRNFTIFYEYGNVRSNRLCVSDVAVTASGTDTTPQITIWGLEHTELFQGKSAREAWVTHIDSYKRSGEQRLVSGLGGNFFSARTYSEAATAYAYPELYPNLFARTSNNRILGPLFYDTGDTPARTRGYITSDGSGTGWVTVTGVEYDAGLGWTKYTLSVPGKTILDATGTPTTLGAVLSTTTDLEDWLTVQQMSYGRHNGTFRIRQILDGADEVSVWVENDAVTSDDYDDAFTSGEAGVFTDFFIWSSTGTFIAGDSLLGEPLGATVLVEVLSGLGTTTVVSGLTDVTNIPGGVLFTGSRTSSVLPLRTGSPSNTASVENLVRGDMLSYTNTDSEWDGRLLRVLYINADSDRIVSVTPDGETATVTLGSGTTAFLAAGQKVLLCNAGVYSGIHVIEDVTSTTTFTLASTETASVTGGILVGKTAEIDEELAWQDSTGDTHSFRCERRWIPVEAPTDSFDLTPATHVRYLDQNAYSSQPFLRSTMVVDNMYLTNYDDEVYKFDGTSLYRTGLLPWQPGLFLTQETGGATIVTSLRSLAYSARVAAEGKLTITSATQNVLPVGTSVRLSGSTKTYTIREYANDGTDYYVFVDRSLDSGVSASGTASEIGTYRYYMRLNAVDANDNIIASAVTSSQDMVVELTGNAAVQLKAVGMPAWDVYDYDRLELQIYRTKISSPAPFYLVTTIPMDFDNTQGYIVYRDSFADSDLTELDEVSTALKGAELGTAWSDPLRARYVTSVGNRLVLGNVRDYPQLDLQIVADATVSATDYDNDSLLFRRDNTDGGTTTDMTNRVRYEWINGTTGTPSAITTGTDEFTVTGIVEPVVAGDWIYLTYSTVAVTGRDPTFSGWWQIASVAGAGPFDATISLVGVTAPADEPDRYVLATDPTDVPVLLGTDGNLGQVNGDSFDTFDAMRRMALAINSTMRMVDTGITGYEDFTPWLITRAGNDLTPAGRLLVRQPRSDATTFEVVPTFSGYSLFVNSVKRATGDQISASVRIFPSRILVSYENYPEIFDSPTVVIDSESDSAIDVNSADGQEITGVIPFFGEAAFGAAQQSAILVVFKTNSIYLVDINEKIAGRNPVQRIETEGLGCTAPYSIAVTKSGIMFANESGIYCLRRNQSIQYIGKYMERPFTESVDLQNLSIAHGHHYGVGRLYKLSVPIAETVDPITGYIENSEVFVYNHTAEAEGRVGAWGQYDNIPALGWANLASDAFFASSLGRVYSIRKTGSETDFRDDSEGVAMSLTLRPNDFGNSGIRKVLDAIIIHYRTGATSTGTAVSYAVDTEEEFEATTPVVITRNRARTGVDDHVSRSIITVEHTISRRRGTYFSVRITNSTVDENIEIAGVDYRVGGLSNKGITQAAET